LPCEENFNGDMTTRLLDALQTEFGEEICVVLDNVSYFTANAVQEFAEGTPIELRDVPRSPISVSPVKSAGDSSIKNLGTVYSIRLTISMILHSLHLTESKFQMSSRTYLRKYNYV